MLQIKTTLGHDTVSPPLIGNSLSSIAQVVREFHHRVSSAVGDELYYSVVKQLALLADADYVFICRFCNDTKSRVRTVAVYGDGMFRENFEFDLSDTPCEKVVNNGPCCYISGVQSQFPLDQLSLELGVDSYIGVPLRDSRGQVLGPMAILGREPLRNNVVAELLLQIYALRAAAEMEHINHCCELDEQKKQFQAIFDAIPHPIFLKDKAGHYTGCNKTLEKNLGISRQHLLGKTVFELAPQRASCCHTEDLAVFDHNMIREYEQQIDFADGSRRDVIFSKAPILNQTGAVTGLVGTILDISQHKRADETIKTLINSMVGLDGQLCLDKVVNELAGWMGAEYAVITEIVENFQIKIIAMYSDFQVVGPITLPFADTPCGSVIAENYCYVASGVQQRFPDCELLTTLEAQSYIGVPLYGEDDTILGTLCVLSRGKLNLPERSRQLMEILAVKVAAELERKNAKVILQKNQEFLDYIANHHQLTGLPNMLLFQDRLQQVINKGSDNGNQVALLHLNLDRFKKINSSLGRTIGNQVMKQVAQRLVQCVGPKGSVSHLNSDEFGIIIENIHEINDVVTLIQQIQCCLGQAIRVDDESLYISTSIGICLYPDDGKDLLTLLRNADAALSRSKELGENHYQFYTTTMNDRARELLQLEANLRKALDLQQFILTFQPQFDLMSQQIVGVEALIRWQHPDHGMILPSDFIPLAEKTGLILDIGEWVLQTACHQNKCWQQSGYAPVTMAVNISARQFSQPGLVELVDRVLADTGLDPQFLELEITESLIMQDVEAAITTMNRLKKIGVTLAIDDFGTGYSSLSYLKHFPIDHLKIDRSFINDVCQQENDAAIATSIIALAHNMRIEAIAEGIETDQQLQFLRLAGCEKGQGYYFDQPLLATELTDRLRGVNSPLHSQQVQNTQ